MLPTGLVVDALAGRTRGCLWVSGAITPSDTMQVEQSDLPSGENKEDWMPPLQQVQAHFAFTLRLRELWAVAPIFG